LFQQHAQLALKKFLAGMGVTLNSRVMGQAGQSRRTVFMADFT
jgi:hypothetical protein